MEAQLVLTALPGIPEVMAGDDLGAYVLQALERADIRLLDGDVLAVAQKVVSKAEGRLRRLSEVNVSPRAARLAAEIHKDPHLIELVLQESREVLRTRPGLIIVEHRLGFVCANAGIDHSNVARPDGEDWVLLLPEDPDASARKMASRLGQAHSAEIGVIILDSHGRPWRLGTVGMAIGVHNVPALLDLRGTPDRHGVPLEITQVGLADELAAAASILLGQAAESRPVVHIRGLPYKLRPGAMKELLRPRQLDLFR